MTLVCIVQVIVDVLWPIYLQPAVDGPVETRRLRQAFQPTLKAARAAFEGSPRWKELLANMTAAKPQ